jgi:adenine-specific DNA-methyltransferase
VNHEDAMRKLTDSDPETRSADVLAGNIEQLKALFPEAFTEGGIDFDVLKQLLGGAVGPAMKLHFEPNLDYQLQAIYP